MNNAPAGLFRFEIGVQSTNDLTNELVQRRQNFEKLTRTVTMVKEWRKNCPTSRFNRRSTRRGLFFISEIHLMKSLKCVRKNFS